MSKFLDTTGFTHFWSKLKTRLDDIESRIGSGTSEPQYVTGVFECPQVDAGSYKDITVSVDFGFTPSTIVFTEDMTSASRIATFDYALLSLSSTSFKVRAKNYHTSGGNTRNVRYIAFK